MSDDPFGSGGDGGDWGTISDDASQDGDIDLNYGQPPSQHEDVDLNYGQPPSQPPAPRPQTQLQSTKTKLDNNDIVAIVLSVFLPGVGHIVLGQVAKGVVILLATLVTCGGFGLIWIAALLDAYLVAMTQKYRDVGEWEFFPDVNQHFGSKKS